jgi:4-amino-4-deoxy-L-arabinose transferase-like glycosyltransferase
MKLPVLALCLICSFLFLFNLQTRDFWAPDEGDFAQISRELDDNPIVPHLNGKPYAEKPPLFYYLIYGSHKLLATVKDEFSMRLPTALIAIGWAVFFFVTVARFFSRKAAIISTLILITSPLYYWQARYLQVDMVFAAFIAGSLLSFFWYLQEGRSVFYYLFFVFVGLAFMTKGPLSVVLTFPTLLLYFATLKDWSIIKKKETYIGLAVFGAIVFPWYLAVYANEGFPFFYENIVRQNFIRFFDAWSHKRPIYYYFTTLPLDFFPWSLFLPMGIWLGARKIRADLKIRFLFIWLAWMFLFFSLSSGKISKYMLPLLPPLSLVAATVFMEGESRYRTGVFVIIGALFFVLGCALFFYKTGLYPQFYSHRIIIGALSIALSLGVACSLAKNKSLYALGALVLFMAATYGAANASVYEKWNPLKSPKSIAEKIRPLIKDGTPWVYYGSMRGVYVYYVGTLAVHVAEHDTKTLGALTTKMPTFFILTRKRDLKEISDTLPGIRPVFEEIVGDTPMVLVRYGG